MHARRFSQSKPMSDELTRAGGQHVRRDAMSVWVKDATNEDFNRSYIEVENVQDNANVGRLKTAVRAEFIARWGQCAEDDVSLFLVSIETGQDEPTKEQEQTAIASVPLNSTKSLEVVNVKRGCFLLAKCTGARSQWNCCDRASSSGTRRETSPQPFGPQRHDIATQHQSRGAARSAFLKVAHESFPAAALLDYQDRLLTQASRPISNRVFIDADSSGAFEAARKAYCTATLDAPKTAPTASVDALDFSAGHYTRRDYNNVEFDCILKVPAADNAEWSRDPAAPESERLFFIAPGERQELKPRSAPVAPVASSRDESQPSAGTRSDATSFSVKHYPPEATHYIVGEVYSPLGEGDVEPFQKLLQAERNLQFLKAQAKAPDIRTCVLGFIFMGPHMSKAMGAKLFNTLMHYQQVLPCLWELQGMQQNKPCRLLGCKVESLFQPAIAFLQTSVQLRDTQATLTGVTDTLATLAGQLQEVNRKLDQRWWCSIM